MMAQKTSPFEDTPDDIARDAKRVRPDLLAEVEFAESTDDGYVRHRKHEGATRTSVPGDRTAGQAAISNGRGN